MAVGSNDPSSSQSASWDKYRGTDPQKSPPLTGLGGLSMEGDLDLSRPSASDGSWVRGLKVSDSDSKVGGKREAAGFPRPGEDEEGWDDTFNTQSNFDLNLYSSRTLEVGLHR